MLSNTPIKKQAKRLSTTLTEDQAELLNAARTTHDFATMVGDVLDDAGHSSATIELRSAAQVLLQQGKLNYISPPQVSEDTTLKDLIKRVYLEFAVCRSCDARKAELDRQVAERKAKRLTAASKAMPVATACSKAS